MIFGLRIDVVELSEMRYRTVGDWYFSRPGYLRIIIADTNNWKYNILVAVHELIEVILCVNDGVTETEVDKFDLAHQADEDPGCHPNCPYGKQHLIAMGIEMTLAALLGVKWRRYEDKLDKVYLSIPKKKSIHKVNT